jgi:pyruvate formate lyase activating enzyme
VEPVPLPPPASPDVEPLFPKVAPQRRFTEEFLKKTRLSLREALFYTPLEDGVVRCDLCPTRCILENGQQGMCRARANVGGKLRSITFGRPVAIHVDPVEKKPLFHVLPGSRAFSVATVGCNLGCVFCQNFEISQATPENLRHREIPPQQLVALSVREGCDGIAYTYTEPTVFFEYMLETGKLARAKGLKNYWITCGQIEEAPLLELCRVLDAANVDLKGFSDEFYVKYCDAHLFPVLRTLKILRQQKVYFEITNLVIPGANDEPDMIRDMCRWIVKVLGPDTPLHFSRFHPAYKLTRRPATPVSTLIRAREIARAEGLHFVFIGNVRDPGFEDSICPICGKTVIERAGYYVRTNNVRDGRCRFCGAPVPGVWR